jgi:hypothetical protein
VPLIELNIMPLGNESSENPQSDQWMSHSLLSAPDSNNTDKIADVANYDSLESSKAHWEI